MYTEYFGKKVLLRYQKHDYGWAVWVGRLSSVDLVVSGTKVTTSLIENVLSLRSRIRIRWLVVEDAAATYKNAGERENGGHDAQDTPYDLGYQAESSKM